MHDPLRHLLVALALGLCCAAWVGVQRLIRRLDPEQPGVEGGCSTCGRVKRFGGSRARQGLTARSSN